MSYVSFIVQHVSDGCYARVLTPGWGIKWVESALDATSVATLDEAHELVREIAERTGEMQHNLIVMNLIARVVEV